MKELERNEDQLILQSELGDTINFYQNGDYLKIYAQDIIDGEQTEVPLDKKQIKELMLFLDRKYGYLLEGEK